MQIGIKGESRLKESSDVVHSPVKSENVDLWQWITKK